MSSPKAIQWCLRQGADGALLRWLLSDNFYNIETMDDFWAGCPLVHWMLWALSKCKLSRQAMEALRKYDELCEDSRCYAMNQKAKAILLRSLLQPEGSRP